ncbi:membrane protein [Spirochaetia bacterium]|nr:membrane protein [Spirochaetia bacterium]
MPDFFAMLSQYIEYFPLLALVCLLLAGLNVPVSEDLIIIAGAVLSKNDHSLLMPTLLAIYTGIVISDFISYGIGVGIRKGALKSKRIQKLVPEAKLEKMRHSLDKYGIWTFIVCRFIPFGIRNTLFISSGLTGLRLRLFALYDIVAATISMNTLFFLVYHFGDKIKKHYRAAGIILLAAGIITVTIITILKKRSPKVPADTGLRST